MQVVGDYNLQHIVIAKGTEMQFKKWRCEMGVIDKYLSVIEETIICVSLFAAMIIVFANVILRYVFNSGLFWPEEMASYLNIFIVYTGCAVAIKLDLHIVIDIMETYAPAFKRKYLDYLTIAVFFMLSFIMIYGGAKFIHLTRLTQHYFYTIDIPMIIAHLIIPITGVMIFLRTLEKLWRTLIRNKEQTS